MMRAILLIVLLINSQALFSQLTKFEGFVEVDSSASPFGQFIIYTLPDSTLIKGGYIDSSYFQTDFNATEGHQYYVKISLAGYKDSIVPFSYSPAVISIPLVRFSSQRTLQTVDIVHKKPEFQRTIDGIKINVQGTTLQTLSSLYDILVASPKLTSPDGESIEIIGKGSPLILIDRQPIITNDELKAIPANMIESMEIITNPSAKYRGQGSSNGVIEVYTKNFTLEGYNMNISASGGLSTQLMPAGTFNTGINIKRKKFSTSANIGINYSKRNGFSNMEGTTTDDVDRSTSTSNNFTGWNGSMSYNVKAAYHINKKQKLSAGFRGHSWMNSSESFNSTSYYTGSILDTYKSGFSDPSGLRLNNSGYLNYKLVTDENKSNLEINANVSHKIGSSNSTTTNTYRNEASGINSEFSIKNESFDQPLAGELKINYEHIFDTTGWQLQTGIYYSDLRNSKTYFQYNRENDQWIEDNLYSNSYDYKEKIGSVYAEITKSWSKFSFRAGMTGEFTGLNGYSNSLQKQFIDSLYILPFPNGSLFYKPNDKLGIRLYYNSGINRPQFSDYDPFIKLQDSLSISYGNPYLQPSLKQSFGFDFDFFDNYSFSVYYSNAQNPISQISFIDDSSFLSITTPWNAKQTNSYGADINIPVQIKKWLSGWNSFWISYNVYEFNPEFKRETFSAINFGAYSYLTFNLKNDFSIMNTLHVMRWGSAWSISNVRTNWGVRLTKKYHKGDFQLYLDISNILPPKNNSTDYYSNFIYTSTGQNEFTTFKAGIYYKFGRLKQAANIQESNSGQGDRF
ncbi:MAG: TonB-dependent receptor [Crocinitomicaceae bacterium]|nr:TonB-dependent receptor [Crocinitomicaceae bacterium]